MNARHSVLALAMLAAASLVATKAVAGTDYLDVEMPTWGRLLGHLPALNGRDLNGVGLNDDALKGRQIVAVSAYGATLDGSPLDAVWAEESRIHATNARGKKVGLKALERAVLQGVLEDGQTLPLYVQSAEQHPSKANKDVWGYEVWYEADSTLAPLCGVDEDGAPILAIPLAGRWNYGEGVEGGGDWLDDPASFTFACEGYVLAKCVVAGYKPWRQMRVCSAGSGCETTTIASYHQACTRALRADYFGDGTAHTVDGTLINMYDGLGIRLDSEPWPIEAEWTEHGAVCVSQTRIPTEQTFAQPLLAEDCGDVTYFVDSTLLITEVGML